MLPRLLALTCLSFAETPNFASRAHERHGSRGSASVSRSCPHAGHAGTNRASSSHAPDLTKTELVHSLFTDPVEVVFTSFDHRDAFSASFWSPLDALDTSACTSELQIIHGQYRDLRLPHHGLTLPSARRS